CVLSAILSKITSKPLGISLLNNSRDGLILTLDSMASIQSRSPPRRTDLILYIADLKYAPSVSSVNCSINFSAATKLPASSLVNINGGNRQPSIILYPTPASLTMGTPDDSKVRISL